MKSLNFEILRDRWPELAGLGGFAESYLHCDPVSALMKIRLFAEGLTRNIYHDRALPKPEQPAFVDLLKNDAFVSVTPKAVLNKLHALRVYGNKAAHGESVPEKQTRWLLREAYDLARWLCVQYGDTEVNQLPAFVEPCDEKVGIKERRKIQEKLAFQESRMEILLRELESLRANEGTVKMMVAPPGKNAWPVEEAANQLNFNEAETRSRIIDNLLASAGWEVGSALNCTSRVGKEIEVDGQPTETGIGYADYVLWDDNDNPLAVIEAKKTAVEAEQGRHQAKLYADSLEGKHGFRPVIFYTNGHDIWMWDDAQNYPPRKLYGFYSKDSLQHLVNYQRQKRRPLDSVEINQQIVDRLYQIETIKRITERFGQKHRKALIVQATGTGKTRVAIALTDLLIRAGWVKRVLFLCDRRELRKQAKNAFQDLLSEPLRIINSRLKSNPSERVFLATYPAMQKIFQSFDVGYFDLIIADESNRSIYNIYKDMFNYLDCYQVGLTATPVNCVTRNTFKLFDCEDLSPTAYYSFEEAVNEDYVIPFEVYEHTTQFLRQGIRLEALSSDQIKELEEQGEDPSEYDFAAQQIDKAIYNRDTNRAILRNLMENGIVDETGQVPGKSIIFARNHNHAMLLRQLFDEMYPQYAGRFCQVIDNYDPRAEQLMEDFKGEGTNDELTIAISVDMLDTGIDVPEIVNLVFAKPIKSPVKFWQMIGRGTRLCSDLSGPGEDKKVFRIFDHWGNFERFGEGYNPAVYLPGKPLAQQVFEERLKLAEAAMQNSDIDIFDMVINLILQDINALPDESIAVREKWKEKHLMSRPEVLKSFEPNTVVRLRQDIAPLMKWRNIQGNADAHRFDLLIVKMQHAVVQGSGGIDDLKIELTQWLGSLHMHLNPIREKAEVIKKVKSRDFWTNISVIDLEGIRKDLREIMGYRVKHSAKATLPKRVDITEDPTRIEYKRRSASLQSVDMKAYRQIIETELKKHFDSDPVLMKIRAGESVSDQEIESLVSLVLTQNPDVRREYLEEFFNETAGPLYLTIRGIVGMDPEAVRDRFAAFVRSHPKLTAKQLQFLSLLQNHIALYGVISVERLYDAPFTVIDADGPDGVFDNEEELTDFIKVVHSFGPTGDGHINNRFGIRY